MIKVQFSEFPRPLSGLEIASLVPQTVKLLGSRSAASLAVVHSMLCTDEEPLVGVKIKPVPSSPKLRYLVPLFPSSAALGASAPG